MPLCKRYHGTGPHSERRRALATQPLSISFIEHASCNLQDHPRTSPDDRFFSSFEENAAAVSEDRIRADHGSSARGPSFLGERGTRKQ